MMKFIAGLVVPRSLSRAANPLLFCVPYVDGSRLVLKPALAIYRKDSERKRIIEAVDLFPGEMLVESVDTYTSERVTAFIPKCPHANVIAKGVYKMRGNTKRNNSEATMKWIYRVRDPEFIRLEVDEDGSTRTSDCQMVVIRREPHDKKDDAN